MSPFDNINFGKATTAFLAFIAGTLIYQGFVQTQDAEDYKPKLNVDCVGDPIIVDFEYYGGFIEPHSCKPQCDDGARRYILYSNGKATQCQPLPGCNDWGEDNGISCKPPEN